MTLINDNIVTCGHCCKEFDWVNEPEVKMGYVLCPHCKYYVDQEGNAYSPPMKAVELLDELTYMNYKYNRQRTPEITPEQWGKIYRNVEALEARYQADLTNDSACVIIKLE